MNSNHIVVSSHEGKFDRGKFQKLPSDQKACCNSLFDKIELIHRNMLPSRTKLKWVLWILIAIAFVGFGSYKHYMKNSNRRLNGHPPYPGPRPHDAGRFLQQLKENKESSPNLIKKKSGQQEPRRQPPPPTQKNPEPKIPPPINPAQGDLVPPKENYMEEEDEENEHRRKIPQGFLSILIELFKAVTYFVIKSFLLIFPIYMIYTTVKSKSQVKHFMRELIEIENKQAITKYQCKFELTKLEAITFIQLREKKEKTGTHIKPKDIIKLYPSEKVNFMGFPQHHMTQQGFNI